MKRVVVNMPDSLFDYLDSKKGILGNTRSAVIIYILNFYFNNEKLRYPDFVFDGDSFTEFR